MAEPVFLKFDRAPHLFVFWCPGCECGHQVDSRKWKFNGDIVRPTVSPSLLVNKDRVAVEHRCHTFIKDGNIQFLPDCTHKLAGKTVPLTGPPWPRDEPDNE